MSAKNNKLEYFRAKLIAVLEKEENEVKGELRKAGYPIGTIRHWKGKDYIKIAPNKWRPHYRSENRAAKMSIAAIKRKIATVSSIDEMLAIVLENKPRFSDGEGKPLDIVKELMEAVKNKGGSELKAVSSTGKKLPKNNQMDRKKGGEEERNNEYGRKNEWFRHVLTEAELKQFIQDARDGKNPGNALIGKVSDGTKKEVKKLTGIDVTKIVLEETSVTHADAPKHKLDPADIEQCVKVINNPVNISLSAMKDPQGLDVVIFEGNVNGTIFFAETVHKKYHGFLSLKTAYRPTPTKKDPGGAPLSQAPGTNVQNAPPSVSQIRVSHESGKKSSEKSGNLDQIRKKYQSGTVIEGDEDEINVDGKLIPGKWKLLEADAPSASHDERTFRKTEGFPETGEGKTVNDNDYEHSKAAQETVINVANDYDSRALSFDNPVVVTPDGVVISGNNRTMSSKIAASKGSDKKYIDALKKRAKKFGLNESDIAKFKHPRVVFETDTGGKYDTDTFAKFNVSDKKASSPIETAVKVGKRIKGETISSMAKSISDFETLGDLYADKKAVNNIFDTFIQSGLISRMDLPQYLDNEQITEAGKEFFETAMIGSVVNENNIRALNKAGAKNIRAKLVRAIVPLVENKDMDGYSINKELNEAVDIAIQVGTSNKFSSVAEFARQQNFFETYDRISVELAKKLEGTQKEFAQFMQSVNGGLRPAANGETDIFLGGVEDKNDILSRMLAIKKAIQNVKQGFMKYLESQKGSAA